ncbi:response regulator [Desulfococcaceae bacterium HSG7]|nr:response regulator [Desulfococcaceae bacterium HSG7]
MMKNRTDDIIKEPGDILVIDDTPENLRVLSGLLTAQGYTVRGVDSGRLALQFLQYNLPDLILLDIRMPDMDGYDVCKQVKADKRTRGIPVIFISALDDVADKVKGFMLGGVDYITKPFYEEEVLVRVETHLIIRNLQKRLEDQNTLLKQEIVERKRAVAELQESEERFRALSSSSFEAIFFSENGVCLDINQAGIDMFGYSYSEAVGMVATDMVAPEHREHVQKKILSGATDAYETIAQKKDGTLFPVEIQAKYADYKGRRVRMTAIRDLSQLKHAKDALKRSEEQYHNLFEMMLNGFAFYEAVYDKDGNLCDAINLDMNPAYELFTGLKKKDTIGKAVSEVMPGTEKTWFDKFDSVVKTGKPVRFEMYHEFTDKYYAVSAYRPCENTFAAVFEDITERKNAGEQLRKSEELFRLVTQTAEIGITNTDLISGKVWWDETSYKIHGYMPETPVTLDFYIDTILLNDDKIRLLPAYQTALESNDTRYRAEYRIVRPDGAVRWLDEDHTIIRDEHGAAIRTYSVKMDITRRKQMEEDLRAAKTVADEANRAKSEFLANMSHELRTPLNAIMGFSQLLGHSTNLDHDEKKNLAIIRSSGEHLLNLINDVLDMSKIEAGRTVLCVEDFDMYHLLDNVEAMFFLKAEEKGLRLVFERDAGVPHYLRADQGKLRQVLVNLIGNALKFTESGGVTVRVEKASEVSPKTETSGIRPLIFEVEDTGEGIAPDELESMFDAFAQTETGRQAGEGTGLGLPISRKFVQMMGGDITVESEVGKGSVFRFEIQAEAVDGAALKTEPPERCVIALEPEQPRFRILIADDIESNRLLLLNMLALPGFEIRNAENGEEALEIQEEWEPHLILMDIRMPVMDGYEATGRIRNAESEIRNGKSETAASHSIPHCKIIAVTANTYEDERAAALSAGCDDFVRKPIKESEIFDVISRHIGVRYVYAEDADAPVPETSAKDKLKALTPEALGALPDELLAELGEATLLGYAEKVKHLIKNIRSHNAALADALAVLNAGYRYDIILESIEKCKGDKK